MSSSPATHARTPADGSESAANDAYGKHVSRRTIRQIVFIRSLTVRRIERERRRITAEIMRQKYRAVNKITRHGPQRSFAYLRKFPDRNENGQLALPGMD